MARQLFFMLAMMTKGLALAIVRQAEISGGSPNGLEAWRLLVRRYEPEAATRTLGLLLQIPNTVPFPENVSGFEEALSTWELTISRRDYSEYQCHNCGKLRHIFSQCWSKSRKGKGKGKGKDKTVSAVQASTSASSASDVGPFMRQ